MAAPMPLLAPVIRTVLSISKRTIDALLFAWKSPEIRPERTTDAASYAKSSHCEGRADSGLDLARGLGVERPHHPADAVRGGPVGMLRLKLREQHRRRLVGRFPLSLELMHARLQALENRTLLPDQRPITDRSMSGTDDG